VAFKVLLLELPPLIPLEKLLFFVNDPVLKMIAGGLTTLVFVPFPVALLLFGVKSPSEVFFGRLPGLPPEL